MLQELCEHVHNYFMQTAQSGSFEIAGGVISLPFALEGQRILIEGSSLNDGLYTYHETGINNDDDTEAAGLADETFTGTIYALKIPPAFIALAQEVTQWNEKYGEAVNSPYQSENVIGVYSYTKAQSGNGAVGWQDIYRDRLKRWRKVAF